MSSVSSISICSHHPPRINQESYHSHPWNDPGYKVKKNPFGRPREVSCSLNSLPGVLPWDRNNSRSLDSLILLYYFKVLPTHDEESHTSLILYSSKGFSLLASVMIPMDLYSAIVTLFCSHSDLLITAISRLYLCRSIL